MSNNGISFSFKKKQIIVNVREYVEVKDVLTVFKKKIPGIKLLYKYSEPEVISFRGRSYDDKEVKLIEKFIARYFKAKVNFEGLEVLGLCGIHRTFNKEINTSETKFFCNSLRSGQKISFKGSIVVLGDVHSGAEVIAGENVVVLGTIRGLVHAGAKGNNEAIISANSIRTPQLRISNVIRNCEKDEYENTFEKTNAYLNDDGNMIIE